MVTEAGNLAVGSRNQQSSTVAVKSKPQSTVPSTKRGVNKVANIMKAALAASKQLPVSSDDESENGADDGGLGESVSTKRSGIFSSFNLSHSGRRQELSKAGAIAKQSAKHIEGIDTDPASSSYVTRRALSVLRSRDASDDAYQPPTSEEVSEASAADDDEDEERNQRGKKGQKKTSVKRANPRKKPQQSDEHAGTPPLIDVLRKKFTKRKNDTQTEYGGGNELYAATARNLQRSEYERFPMQQTFQTISASTQKTLLHSGEQTDECGAAGADDAGAGKSYEQPRKHADDTQEHMENQSDMFPALPAILTTEMQSGREICMSNQMSVEQFSCRTTENYALNF